MNQANKHIGYLATILAVAALCSFPGHADPGDFGAMPGLWKTVTQTIAHGHAGKPVTQWHCVDEGADPWAAFATATIPDVPDCKPGDQHRGSTALAWTLTCPGHPQAKAQVNFDSAEHYTGNVALPGRGDIVRIEGKRYAACTSPSD